MGWFSEWADRPFSRGYKALAIVGLFLAGVWAGLYWGVWVAKASLGVALPPPWHRTVGFWVVLWQCAGTAIVLTYKGKPSDKQAEPKMHKAGCHWRRGVGPCDCGPSAPEAEGKA